jgi:hypothetical protein
MQEGNLIETQEDNVEMPELKTGEQIAQIVEKIYEISPRLASALVESNAILCMAGYKAYADLTIPTNKEPSQIDKEIADAIDSANRLFAKSLSEFRLNSRGESKVSRIGKVIWLCPYNLHGFERNTKSTKIPGIPIFNTSEGFDKIHESEERLKRALEEQQKEKKFPPGSNNIEIVQEGIELGYPDQAIYDFMDWYNGDRKKELQSANIVGTGTYPEAQPVFDFYPEHEFDPQIQKSILNAAIY